MIPHLDNLLRTLLMRLDGISEETQVGFQPPDEDWRNHVSGLQGNALNIYLADLRENRKLRSNETIRRPEDGVVLADPAPIRVDCHYLVSAWSPALVTPAVEPTLDEHGLLYDALALLMREAPLNASRIYPAESAALQAVPEPIRDVDLPTEILPEQGFPKLAELWGTMGANHRWKPALYLVVTLPVTPEAQIAGAMVTTRITEYRQTGRPGPAEAWVRIGGHALTPEGDTVAGAWVRLETLEGDPVQTAETDEQGRYTFGELRPGNYRLRARAGGFDEIVRDDVAVPSPTGEYDLSFETSD